MRLFATDTTWLAGSGAVGTATKVGNQYRITGYWQYASGAQNATAFTMNCALQENGTPLKNPDGTPTIVSVVLMKDEITVHATWNAMGLVASGTHAFEAKDVLVSEDRLFYTHKPVIAQPLYQYPFLQMAEVVLASTVCGMGFHFLDLCDKAITGKASAEKGTYEKYENIAIAYNKLFDKFLALRQKMHYALDVSWQQCMDNKPIKPAALFKVSSTANACTNMLREVVSAL
ncbi:MAG: hypothetical protein EBX41_03010 [Chitinophagia bacterium]|nr:hypothetical protein [Chitinophagia bacterium]